MAINGGPHKFNKNANNWLHKHFEPQQVDVVVSSISILALDSLSAFAQSLTQSFNLADRIDPGQVLVLYKYVL